MSERVVSLAPSGTRIVRALDAGDRLVGLTDHGDAEEGVGGWLTPDLTAVTEAEPDLVLTTDELQSEIADRLRAAGIEVAHFDPRTLDDVGDYIRDVGAALDRADAADRLADTFESRIAVLRERHGEGPRPVVYCEEWGDPPMVAGNWVPEVVEVAGGRYPFCAPGERSRPIERPEIEEADPHFAFVHHCGIDDPRSDALEARGWAVPEVHVMSDDLLNQPGPQLADAAARIAAIMDAA